MKKHKWYNLRISELEEKAGVVLLPEFDMDGSRFVPGYSNAEFLAEEDFLYSISKRLISFNLDPYQDDVRLMAGDSNFGE